VQCLGLRIGSGFELELISVQRRRLTVAPALAEALGAGEPVVVDVVSDVEPRAPKPWVPA
jgi:hypothetical protein